MTPRRDTPKNRAFRERYGPTAIVTGAAQGIGRAFADAAAERGLNVLLLDVQEEAVREAATSVAAEFEVSTWAAPIDLARRDFLSGVTAIVARARIEVGLVICNAAIGLEGSFLDESLDDLHRAVDVNCHAAMTLTHHFGKEMAERRRGGLVLIASGTALQGSPRYANYAATKAFNLVLGESLWYEMKDHDVDVLSYVPGPTNTPGMRKSMPKLEEGVEVGPIRLPDVTAKGAMDALGKRASAARERVHTNRLASRRRAADEIVAETAKRQERALARSRGSE
jgi:hypothetical protein